MKDEFKPTIGQLKRWAFHQENRIKKAKDRLTEIYRLIAEAESGLIEGPK